MKRFLSLLLAAIMMLSISAPAYAAESVQGLEEAYQNIITYAEENNIDLDMTYEDFLASYNGESAAEYEQMFYPVFSAANPNARSSSSSGSSKYYYNTGTTCPNSATYSKYNLLDVVKKGDIIFEANGGFGITGHVAIVEGIYSRGDGTNYIRLIEAIDLQFENKTANCVVHITGNSMNESIDITVKLWYGNRCVVTWTNSGKGVLHFSNTYDVAYKGEYKLSVDATIGGEKYDTVSVKNSCG